MHKQTIPQLFHLIQVIPYNQRIHLIGSGHKKSLAFARPSIRSAEREGFEPSIQV